MKSDSFKSAFAKTEKKLMELQNQMKIIKYLIKTDNSSDTYEALLKLEEISEKTVLLTRVLPAYTGTPCALADVNDTIRLSIPMEIGFTAEGFFSIRIPALLPKKSEGSADYIRSSLYLAMKDFFMKSEPVRFTDCVLIYRHVYSRDRPERKKRDHDNIEVNMVSDIIAMYVMPDDGPDVCSHYYCSAEGNSDRTEVYVVPKHKFSKWLLLEKDMDDKGVKLYETRILRRKKDM